MAKNRIRNKKPQSEPAPKPVPEAVRVAKSSRALLAARACLAGAAAVAAWLLWYAIIKKPMAGCGPGSPCDKVMGSSWAWWLGVPVSAPALASYVALLACSFLTQSRARPDTAARAWRWAIFLSAMIVGSALWFTGLQLLVLKTVCKFCSTAHFLSVAGIVLLMSQAPVFAKNQPASPALRLRKPQLALLVFFGLLMVGLLVAGQKYSPRNTNVLQVRKGAFHFDLGEVPLIGYADAPHFVVSLFDYTCPDCQDMHRQLASARERFKNQFSIVPLPMPLDGKCNHFMLKTPKKHEQACEYARLGLALRRLGPNLFEEYDRWFFSQSGTPKLEVARQKAVELAGQSNLDKALADPWVDKMIQTSISLYGSNYEATHSGRMPQIFVGDFLSIGPTSTDDLMKLLQTNFQLAAP